MPADRSYNDSKQELQWQQTGTTMTAGRNLADRDTGPTALGEGMRTVGDTWRGVHKASLHLRGGGCKHGPTVEDCTNQSSAAFTQQYSTVLTP